jgi:hypothetical protein
LREDDRKAAVKFGRGGAVGKRAFVGRVGGALPFSDVDDAERTSGETRYAERDASKPSQQRTRRFCHRNIPHAKPQDGCYHRLYCGPVEIVSMVWLSAMSLAHRICEEKSHSSI